MDLHVKKLNEIRKTVTVNRNDVTKKVEDTLNKRHQDKIRTYEFLKQGK